MELRSLLPCSLLTIHLFVLSFTSAKPSAEKRLASKISRLNRLAGAAPLIDLNTDLYRQLVSTQPKNYSVVVIFTMKSADCQICGKVLEIFNDVAEAWQSSPYRTEQLFFASIEYERARELFRDIAIEYVPYILHIGSTNTPQKEDIYQIGVSGLSPLAILRWALSRAGVHNTKINIIRKTDYSFYISVMTVSASIVMLAAYRKSLDTIYNKTAWGVMIYAGICVGLSGQMWNKMNGAPLLHRHPHTGAIEYITRTNEGQTFLESSVVAILYSSISLGMIILASAGAQGKQTSRRSYKAMFGFLVFLSFFTVLLSSFSMKHEDYPYALLLTREG